MKIESLVDLALSKNLTIARAAIEVICAAGERKRTYPVIIRKQHIPLKLLKSAKNYETRVNKKITTK